MRELQEVELKEFQTEYLNNMVTKYDLPDIGKAIRCLIDFSIEKDAQEAEIFKEERCHSCDWSGSEQTLKNERAKIAAANPALGS